MPVRKVDSGQLAAALEYRCWACLLNVRGVQLRGCVQLADQIHNLSL